MKVCGVELKGNEAIVSILALDQGLFDIPKCRVQKLDINDANSTEDIRRFQFTFAKLMADYKVDQVVIRQRPLKGKFAGGAIGFKMETAIQLAADLNVDLISSQEIKEIVKKNPMPVDFSGTGLKKFQEPAFTTAYAYLSRR